MSKMSDSGDEEMEETKVEMALLGGGGGKQTKITFLMKETTQLYYISALLAYSMFICLFFYGSISFLTQLFGFSMNVVFWIKLGLEFGFTVSLVFFVHFKNLNLMNDGRAVKALGLIVQFLFYGLIIIQIVFNITYVVWISIDVDKYWEKVDTPMYTKTARVFQVCDICMVGIDIIVKMVLMFVMYRYFDSLKKLIALIRK